LFISAPPEDLFLFSRTACSWFYKYQFWSLTNERETYNYTMRIRKGGGGYTRSVKTIAAAPVFRRKCVIASKSLEPTRRTVPNSKSFVRRATISRVRGKPILHNKIVWKPNPNHQSRTVFFSVGPFLQYIYIYIYHRIITSSHFIVGRLAHSRVLWDM